MGVFFKAARIGARPSGLGEAGEADGGTAGERLSPYVALSCVVMAVQVCLHLPPVLCKWSGQLTEPSQILLA